MAPAALRAGDPRIVVSDRRQRPIQFRLIGDFAERAIREPDHARRMLKALRHAHAPPVVSALQRLAAHSHATGADLQLDRLRSRLHAVVKKCRQRRGLASVHKPKSRPIRSIAPSPAASTPAPWPSATNRLSASASSTWIDSILYFITRITANGISKPMLATIISRLVSVMPIRRPARTWLSKRTPSSRVPDHTAF